MNDLEFHTRWKPTGRCHYQEKQGNIKYCNKDRTNCEHQSTFQIPYAKDGIVGGRKFECKR